MAIIFTPDYFKEQFRNGKSIRQIASENFVSPSYVSHIVCGFEKTGQLKKIDRCTVPPDLTIIYTTDKRVGIRGIIPNGF